MQTIAPTKDNIFAKPLDKETKTKSGFLLSETHVDAPKQAEVINVGEDVKTVRSGDTIVYKAYAPTDVKLNDKDYLMIREEDVLGVVTEVNE